MKVFLAATSLSSTYGGPAYSVSRLASELAATRVEVALWSADGSPGDFVNRSPEVRELAGGLDSALREFGRPDLIHDNGLWRAHNNHLANVARRQRIPRVVSTRGMMEPWAMSHKKWKKMMAWPLYQRRDIISADAIHATSQREAENITRRLAGIYPQVISNGIDLPNASGGQPSGATHGRGNRTALFLGRIYPVKGLPMLVAAWNAVRPEGWRLRIAGPDESGHRRVVERAVERAGLSDAVSFAGPVRGAAKEAEWAEADLFILPSYSENFGLSVGEALAHSVPVLTTTAAPWAMLRDRGCGWSVAPTVEALTDGLRIATSFDSLALHKMGERGREFVSTEFQWRDVANRFKTLYETLIQR
ncbi:MAG: glycosyltransferase [Gemmatimonadales bacterium]